MSEFAEIAVGELFNAVSGKPKYTRSYVEEHPGPYPIYSASLAQAFGHVDEFDYQGHYLTWVMNGYGGRVQEVTGRFGANRDRGVLVPKDPDRVPDLTYLRFALESQLMAAALGRRVDGRLNEYTKIYPETAAGVLIRVPLTAKGKLAYRRMARIGDRLRRIDRRQAEVRAAHDELARATVALDLDGPTQEYRLADPSVFALSIGRRVLRSEHSKEGVPVYSANVMCPFGFIKSSPLGGFDRPSLLWGIDGRFDWNLVPAGVSFATTDHCGRVQILDERLDPEYVWAYLKFTRARYGFDRVFRASLRNVRDVLAIQVPVDGEGAPLLERQQAIAQGFRTRERAQRVALNSLTDVLQARVAVDN
jgi:hypothetical protein